MKKFIIALFVVALMVGGTPVFAAGPHNTAGAKVDVPNLIRFTENLTFGIEGGKDMATDVFYKEDDGVTYLEADRGYFAYVKITWTGSLFDFSKK